MNYNDCFAQILELENLQFNDLAVNQYIDMLNKLKQKVNPKHFGDEINLAFKIPNSPSVYGRTVLFDSDNWNDLVLILIRAVIDGDILPKDKSNKLTIEKIWRENQTTAIIRYEDELDDNALFISWYKNRGRTEAVLTQDLRVASLYDVMQVANLILDHYDVEIFY